VFEVVAVIEEPPVMDERPRDELAADVSLWLVVVDALDAQSSRLNSTFGMRIDGVMGVCGCSISRRTEDGDSETDGNGLEKLWLLGVCRTPCVPACTSKEFGCAFD
jgi:hypothetical protein